MLPAIQIDLPDARVMDAERIAMAVAACRYQLKDAEVRVWQKEGLQVTEQAFDFENKYISYLEARVAHGLAAISFHTPKDDLFWLYVLTGKITIQPLSNGMQTFEVEEIQFRISYLPAGKYICQLDEGVHNLFYIVHKPRTILREKSRELPMDYPPIAAVIEKLRRIVTSEGLPMDDDTLGLIRRFLRKPGSSYINRKEYASPMAAKLISYAYEAVQRQEAVMRSAEEYVAMVKMYIDECIQTGHPVSVASLQDRYPEGQAVDSTAFKDHTGSTIIQYLRDARLEHAKQMLDHGETPTQAAYYVNWSYRHLSRLFVKKYSLTPGAYVQHIKDKPNG